jgi:lysyl endopeptidase
VLTANHCIATAATASTLTTLWFYENADCAGLNGVKAGQLQLAGGSQVVLTNADVDSTLLLLNAAAPEGAVHSGWSTARLAANAPIVSISHPAGDTSRLAQGAISREYRIVDHPIDMYGVRFSSGIIQGGSSGSGLFTLNAAGSLQLAGVLSGTTVRNPGGLSCTNLNEEGLYGRFEVFGRQVAPYISLPQRAADDAPNRLADVATSVGALDTMPGGVNIEGRRIDYAGDLDLYRFTLTQSAYVSVSTYGANIDTVGSLLDSRGESLESEDDAQRGDNHFGITRRLIAGTYHVQVGHWEADGTGPYNLRLHAARVEENYTDLWWNAAESGWGINFNHQGDILFGTLFTYDAQGNPMWLVMSGGTRQADSSYQGELYRASGPVFNAVPFGGVALAPVGTMRVSFPTPSSGNLTYTVDGTQVTKAITRQAFRSLPSCTWSGFDRSYASNYQDLWWNPAEPGWGVNIAHQEDILFATLFTYDANRQPVWYVMSEGSRNLSGGYSGTLYRTRGAAFNASPWTPATVAQVGTMSFSFSGGNAGTMTYSVDGVSVTKQIQRQVFSEPRTSCSS